MQCRIIIHDNNDSSTAPPHQLRLEAVRLARPCGFARLALFAAASRRERRPESLVSPLYAADLAGGALGSALASVWLLPLAGLTLTALLTILVLLLGSLLA